MRVVRVIGVLEPGGAQLSMLRLAVAQAALGVQTVLVAGDATPLGVELARQHRLEPLVYARHDTLDCAPRQWSADPGFAAWLRPHVANADLVHAHMFGAWWAAAQATPADVPLVASEHNAVTWPLGDHTPDATEAARRLDLFYAHGPAARAFAQLIGVDSDRLRGRSAVPLWARPRPGLETPRLTFTGRFRADKGPDLLVRALAELPDPPTTYLVGDGPMTHDLHRMIRRLRLDDRVRMPGWSFDPARYVARSTVHVVPSREEAWSQSAVTALALGVPVVATAVEGLPETLADGRGLLVPPEDPGSLADSIHAVLTGTQRVDTEAGRRYAGRFGAPLVAADCLDGYRWALTHVRPSEASEQSGHAERFDASTIGV